MWCVRRGRLTLDAGRVKVLCSYMQVSDGGRGLGGWKRDGWGGGRGGRRRGGGGGHTHSPPTPSSPVPRQSCWTWNVSRGEVVSSTNDGGDHYLTPPLSNSQGPSLSAASPVVSQGRDGEGGCTLTTPPKSQFSPSPCSRCATPSPLRVGFRATPRTKHTSTCVRSRRSWLVEPCCGSTRPYPARRLCEPR